MSQGICWSRDIVMRWRGFCPSGLLVYSLICYVFHGKIASCFSRTISLRLEKKYLIPYNEITKSKSRSPMHQLPVEWYWQSHFHFSLGDRFSSQRPTGRGCLSCARLRWQRPLERSPLVHTIMTNLSALLTWQNCWKNVSYVPNNTNQIVMASLYRYIFA